MVVSGTTRRAVLAAGPAVLAAAPVGAAPPPTYDRVFTTRHEGVFNGRRLVYDAMVEPTVLTGAAGQPTARFVGAEGPTAGKRPVIFAFAGGPSNAATAYHMRLLGPRRIMEPPPGADPSDFTLTDNRSSVLDVADVVLVDTAETGFSRILPAGDRRAFYSLNGDTRSIEQFMAAWLKAHDRESSPRYVMGGSYGSVRAIRIGWDLRQSAPVDGVIMTANSSMIREMTGVIGQAAGLPPMTMTALYHGKIARNGRSDAEVADDAYTFAMGAYLPALARVQDLSFAARAHLADELEAFTGISGAVFLDSDLELGDGQFSSLLLKDRGLVLDDRLDGRSAVPVGQSAKPDGAERALFDTYMRDELGVTYPMSEYRSAAPDTGSWTFQGPNGEPRNDWSKLLREQMAANPRMRVLSANGYYDLTSSFGQARQLFSRTRLPRDRITVREYPGGHALYQTPDTAARLSQDIRDMLAARTGVDHDHDA